MLTLLVSCKQEAEITSPNPQQEKTNPIADPNHFIGKHKTKASWGFFILAIPV